MGAQFFMWFGVHLSLADHIVGDITKQFIQYSGCFFFVCFFCLACRSMCCVLTDKHNKWKVYLFIILFIFIDIV